MHHLFLDSRDSTVHHPANTSYDFIVELSKPLVLRGEWECALMEISLPSSRGEICHVCSDVIEDSYARNTLFPVLRTIPTGRNGYFLYHRPYFLPVRARELTRIRMFIRGENLQSLPPEDSSSVHCVLVLRQRRWDP
jgi:hypothetical protein